jgi:hypothetical protein
MASGTFAVAVNGAGMSGLGYWSTTDDSANNRTLVSSYFNVSKASGFSPTFGNGSWSITIAGNTYPVSQYFTISAGETKTVMSHSFYVAHAANGTGSAAISVSGGISGTSWTTTSGSTTLTLTDYVRVPSTPTSPTLSRSSSGLVITVTSATATSPVTITDYEAQWQVSGGPFTTVSLGNDATGNITVPSSTTTYLVQTRAVSAEGNGGWSPSSSIVGVPGAPATITATRTGRSVTVVAGTSSGSGVTNYFSQYSSNGGSTWSTADTMTGQSFTYNSLTAGQTYIFRAYSTNAIGNSDFAVSAAVFVPAGGRRYDGTAFTPTSTAKRWNGTDWVDLTTAKRWTGSTWADLT